MNRSRIVIDIDGVIARWGQGGPKTDWDYSSCVMIPGADMALFWLSNKHDVILSSARRVEDMATTVAWLERNGIMSGSHYRELHLGSKPPAALYVDDRAYRFGAGLWTLAEVERISQLASEGKTNE